MPGYFLGTQVPALSGEAKEGSSGRLKPSQAHGANQNNHKREWRPKAPFFILQSPDFKSHVKDVKDETPPKPRNLASGLFFACQIRVLQVLQVNCVISVTVFEVSEVS
jgi:hypothetical protein